MRASAATSARREPARRSGSRPGSAPACCRARPAAGPRSPRCRSPGCLVWAGGALAARWPPRALVFALGLWAADRYMHAVGVHDPGAVVIDEIAGQWLTLCVAPLDPLAYLLGFVLFRDRRRAQALAGELARPPGRRRRSA